MRYDGSDGASPPLSSTRASTVRTSIFFLSLFNHQHSICIVSIHRFPQGRPVRRGGGFRRIHNHLSPRAFTPIHHWCHQLHATPLQLGILNPNAVKSIIKSKSVKASTTDIFRIGALSLCSHIKLAINTSKLTTKRVRGAHWRELLQTRSVLEHKHDQLRHCLR